MIQQNLSSYHFPTRDIHQDDVLRFQDIIYTYYRHHGRQFPWRSTTDPYCILVSEIMLQQTQTDRVVNKYLEFLTRFPDFQSLATASFHEVLSVWYGLGYNRRAKALHDIATLVVANHQNKLPNSAESLEQLPGIGPYTAQAIMAFAFNKPAVLLETNIRTVFIHFFFNNTKKVHDSDIQPLIKRTMDTKQPRIWYYALMDYGVMLKKQLPHVNERSAHYTKQSPFAGSNRQLRGMILRTFIKQPRLTVKHLRSLPGSETQHTTILSQLEHEGLLSHKGRHYTLADKKSK